MKAFLHMVFAPWIFAKRELDRLGAPCITEAGWEVMKDPEKMKKVNKAIEEHRLAGKHGSIIVELD